MTKSATENTNIVIETINNIEFKANKKSSNFYIKNEDGKFERVKSAEFAERKKEAANAEAEGLSEIIDETSTIDLSNVRHFLAVDMKNQVKVEDADIYEMSCGKRKYNKNHVYLAESIARVHGVMLMLSINRINGHRVFKFIGDFGNIQAAIEEINFTWSKLNTMVAESKVDGTNETLDSLTPLWLHLNKELYKDIDAIVEQVMASAGVMILDLGW